MSEDLLDPKKFSKRTGLGRGLGSLLGDDISNSTGGFEEKRLSPNSPLRQEAAAQPNASSEYQKIAIERLIPNREQPRKQFAAAELEELASSIKQKGLIQPILVKADGKNFQIIAGERRWRASQKAGLTHVPVIIRDAKPQEVLELALIENIQRHDLNPLEEAEAYSVLAEKYSLTQQQIADRVGKDRATVANVMRVLGLPREVRDMLKDGQIQLGHAKALLALGSAMEQVELARKCAKSGLSVRALEKLTKAKPSEMAGEIEVESPEVNQTLIKALANELQKKLGTRVQIEFNGQKGRLDIAFYSVQELNRISDKLRR